MIKYLAIVLLLTYFAHAETIQWKTFGKGKENERYANLFIIEYPSDFIFSPDSNIFPLDYKGKVNPNNIGGPGYIQLISSIRNFSITAISYVPHFFNSDGFPMTCKETRAYVYSFF